MEIGKQELNDKVFTIHVDDKNDEIILVESEDGIIYNVSETGVYKDDGEVSSEEEKTVKEVLTEFFYAEMYFNFQG